MLTELETRLLKHLIAESGWNGHDFGVWCKNSAREGAGMEPEVARGLVTSLQKKGLIEDWCPLGAKDGASPSVLAQYVLSSALIQLDKAIQDRCHARSADEGRPIDISATTAEYVRVHGLSYDQTKLDSVIVWDI